MNLMPWIYGFVICRLRIGAWLFWWVTVKVTMLFIWINLLYIGNPRNEKTVEDSETSLWFANRLIKVKTVVNFEISIQLLNLHSNVVTAVKCQIIGAEIEIY